MALIELPKGRYENLPPNSFSSGDILRIMTLHLTRIERLHIMYVFLIVIPSLGLVTDLIEVINLLFKPSKIVMRILKAFRVWDMIVERVNPLSAAMLMMVLPESTRKEAKKFVEKVSDEFYLQE